MIDSPGVGLRENRARIFRGARARLLSREPGEPGAASGTGGTCAAQGSGLAGALPGPCWACPGRGRSFSSSHRRGSSLCIRPCHRGQREPRRPLRSPSFGPGRGRDFWSLLIGSAPRPNSPSSSRSSPTPRVVGQTAMMTLLDAEPLLWRHQRHITFTHAAQAESSTLCQLDIQLVCNAARRRRAPRRGHPRTVAAPAGRLTGARACGGQPPACSSLPPRLRRPSAQAKPREPVCETPVQTRFLSQSNQPITRVELLFARAYRATGALRVSDPGIWASRRTRERLDRARTPLAKGLGSRRALAPGSPTKNEGALVGREELEL